MFFFFWNWIETQATTRTSDPRNLGQKGSFTKLKYGPNHILHLILFISGQKYKSFSWHGNSLHFDADAIWTQVRRQVILISFIKLVSFNTLAKLASYQKSYPVATTCNRSVSATVPAHSPSSRSGTQKWRILCQEKKVSFFLAYFTSCHQCPDSSLLLSP